MPVRKPLLICALVFSISSLVFAQSETGGIGGSVQDEEGKAIPGVTLTASNIRLTGLNSSTYTNVDGTYRFPVLLPGEYEIKAELQGFQPVARKDIRILLGQTVLVNFVLRPQPLLEVVEIQGETKYFDVNSPSLSKTVPREEIESLPKFASAFDLFTLTPGVGEDHVSYGSTPLGNAHWFDGVDMTNQLTGRSVAFLNYNWIEEVQVAGLGAPAEYGGFTGVVANSISRSGSNQFHGLLETFFHNENLTSTNTPDPGPEMIQSWDVSAQIGGSIVPGRLWFFSGFQYLYIENTPFGFDGVMTQKAPRFITKLTYKPNQNNTLQGFIERDTIDITGSGANALTLPEGTALDERPEWFWNLNWISALKPETFLDIRTSGFVIDRNVTALDPNLPGHRDLVTQLVSVNFCCPSSNHRVRNQLKSALSHYANDFLLGNHDFKFGVEYQRLHPVIESYFSGGILYLDRNGARFIRRIDDGSHLDAVSSTVTTFAQDHWQVTDHLNFSIGVRWDHNVVEILSAPVRSVTDGIAPRVGVVYSFHEDRTTVLKAHYGHYYDGIVSRLSTLIQNSDVTTQQFHPQTNEWVTVNIRPTVWAFDDHLKQPYAQQFTTGVDQVLPAGVSLSAHYIYKRDRHLIEDINPTSQYEPVPFVNVLTGETITVYKLIDPGDGSRFITNPQGLFRRYHGFEIYGSKKISEKFFLAGSIVFSRIRGNADNDLLEGPLPRPDSFGVSGNLDSPNSQINSEGVPENDVSTEVKLHGYYHFLWGINTSWYFRHFSGDTWTPLLSVAELDPVANYIFALPRGSNRLPDRNIVDIRLEKMFSIYRGQLRFTVDVFNLFNTAYPLAVVDLFESPDFGTPTLLSAPREIRVGVRYTF